VTVIIGDSEESQYSKLIFMFHKEQQFNEKGSTLFLAMVVMGIMLILGVGVATILVNQIRETAVIEETAIAFYVKETAIDSFSTLDSWIEITWSGEKKLEYKVTENAGEYDFAIRINDASYYFFGKESSGTGPDPEEGDYRENTLFLYYDNPFSWTEATMRYQAQLIDDSLVIYTDTMTPSSYSGWFYNEVDVTDIKKIRTYFCDGPAEVNDGCNDIGLYPSTDRWNNGNWNTTGLIAVVCVEDETEKPCNSPETFFMYYNNPNGWSEVTMRYQVNSTSGDVLVETMTESTDYSGWFYNEIDTGAITQLRTYFCDGPAEVNDGCSDDGMYGWWLVSDTRMVCVENGVDKSCFSPETDF
jgi:type II secretory pathway pseudopilin PulG